MAQSTEALDEIGYWLYNIRKMHEKIDAIMQTPRRSEFSDAFYELCHELEGEKP